MSEEVGRFLTNHIRIITVPVVSASTDNEEKANSDLTSIAGKFGWVKIGDVYVPFIFRNNERYCSVRILDVKIWRFYTHPMCMDLFRCTTIKSFYMTGPECCLFNEINAKHCDNLYGNMQFTTRDLVIKHSDAYEFHVYIHACSFRLQDKRMFIMERCGFIWLNRESIIPYTWHCGEKYVPLFYFDGDIDALKHKSINLEGWDLTYLKFCCKIQGIDNQFTQIKNCSVINLEEIKKYYPERTNFEECWPINNLFMGPRHLLQQMPRLTIRVASRSQIGIIANRNRFLSNTIIFKEPENETEPSSTSRN